MSLRFRFNYLRRASSLLMLVVTLMVALLPTAAFASGHPNDHQAPNEFSQYDYPRQGIGYDPNELRRNGNQNDHGDRYNDYDHRHHNSRCEVNYRIKRGDTLSQIARYFHVSLYKLAQVNNIKNPNRIYAGNTLCIPR
jgi:nucleoid-associated protein YgaU